MKVIYISGHYRDKRGAYYILENILSARRAALEVWKIGGVALCPHLNTAFFDGAFDISDTVWLDGDLELISRCDAVLLLSDWENSLGAVIEKEKAEDLGIPVFTTMRQVKNFILFNKSPAVDIYSGGKKPNERTRAYSTS